MGASVFLGFCACPMWMGLPTASERGRPNLLQCQAAYVNCVIVAIWLLEGLNANVVIGSEPWVMSTRSDSPCECSCFALLQVHILAFSLWPSRIFSSNACNTCRARHMCTLQYSAERSVTRTSFVLPSCYGESAPAQAMMGQCGLMMPDQMAVCL